MFERKIFRTIFRSMDGTPTTSEGRKARDKAIEHALDDENLGEFIANQRHLYGNYKSALLIFDLASGDEQLGNEAIDFIERLQRDNVEDDGQSGRCTAILVRLGALLDIDSNIMIIPEDGDGLRSSLLSQAKKAVKGDYFSSFISKNIDEIKDKEEAWAKEVLSKMNLSLDSLSWAAEDNEALFKQMIFSLF